MCADKADFVRFECETCKYHTRIQYCRILCRIAVLRTYMQPIVTDRVAWSVGVSVCRSVCQSVCHTSEPCKKTAAPIELPFGLKTWVGPGNHVLDEGPDPPMRRGKFFGEKGRPIVKYRDTLRSSVQRQLNR